MTTESSHAGPDPAYHEWDCWSGARNDSSTMTVKTLPQ